MATRRQALLVLGAAVGGYGISRVVRNRAAPPRHLELSGHTMGTRYQIRLPAAAVPDSLDLERLRQRIERRLAAVVGQMSTHAPDSDLSRFNRYRGGEAFELGPEFAAVMAEAQTIGALSQGTFDVTIGPLVERWGFGPRQTPTLARPSRGELRRLLDSVGGQRLELDAERRLLRKAHPDTAIDLSSIAKGYGVDAVADELARAGINDYLVDIGGELRVQGVNPQGLPWTLAIEAPLPGVRQALRLFRPGTAGVATSGNYRQFYTEAGRRYTHIIDPRLGRPVRHSLASVTVAADRAMSADAIATALMVLGPERGYAFALEHKLAAYFVGASERSFEQRATPAFEGLLTA